MYHAKKDDIEKIMNIFKANRKWFPHVREYHIKTRIERNQVILEDDVVITYHLYTRNQPLSIALVKKLWQKKVIVFFIKL